MPTTKINKPFEQNGPDWKDRSSYGDGKANMILKRELLNYQWKEEQTKTSFESK